MEHRVQITARQSLLASIVIRLSTTVVTKCNQSKQANYNDSAGEHTGNPAAFETVDHFALIDKSDTMA
jgi:hypothetical protein